MTDLAQFDGLSFFRYRFDLTFERALAIPGANRAVLWRGAFGSVFRSLVCHDVTLACETCPLRAACPFPRVFSPSVPEGRPAILRLRDPPRPFVLVDPQPTAARLPASQIIGLELVVVGTAVTELPYFVVALRRLGSDGIGRARVRFDVEAVHTLGAAGQQTEVVFARGSDLVRPVRRPLRARDLELPGDAGAGRVRVRFVTPTDLRGLVTPKPSDTEPEGPSFGLLVRRARDRVGALATFFGSAPIEHDPRGLGELADTTRLVGAQLTRAAIARRSSRTGERHAIGGWLGTAVYEGPNVGAALPWLRLSEALGVGKHATFGNGRIAVEIE